MNGKVVFITGAARGIGAATARVAAARGARIALAGLEPDLLAEVASKLREAVWFECDVTDQASLDRAVAGTVEAYGRIDAVVANAGVAPRGTIASTPVDAHVRTIEVNLLGVVRTVSATMPHVLAAKGYYLLVASAAAYTALPGMAAYCASKAGVEHFGNALRLELGYRGVAVGTAHPSWVDTDMVRDVTADLPTFRETLTKLPPPLGRLTTVDACAKAFVDGIQRRRRRVFVPRTVGMVAALRTMFVGRTAERVIGRTAATSVPAMESEVEKLGRHFGEHSTETKH
jgi:NAD(P)-dependent dehydrogenase (short-subunit alcohol dehydrogenase family)